MATYTYSATRGGDLDRARELLGDTPLEDADGDTLDEALALRSDEQIQAVLDREGFARGVAWLAAALYAEYAQQPVRTSVSGLSVDYSDRLEAWNLLAAPLRAVLAGEGERPPPARAVRVGLLTNPTTDANLLR